MKTNITKTNTKRQMTNNTQKKEASNNQQDVNIINIVIKNVGKTHQIKHNKHTFNKYTKVKTS